MATYTYTCDNEFCEIYSSEIPVQQSMTAEPLSVICTHCGEHTFRRVIANQTGGFRIGGVPNSTSMWNVSGDPGPRRKGYDCDPMN